MTVSPWLRISEPPITVIRALQKPETAPSRTRPRIFYGWWVAIACGASIGTGAGVSFWSFGILILPLEQEFGWLRGELSGGFSVSWLISGVVAPFVGWAVGRFGPPPPFPGG